MQPIQHTPYRIDQIDNSEMLDSIAPTWRQLSSQVETSVLHTSYEWLRACWRHHFARRAELCVLAIWDAERLRGIVPLRIEELAIAGIRVRVGRFLGEGPSDYGDLLLLEPEDAMLDAIAAYLTARDDLCDLLELREFFGESAHGDALLFHLAAYGWKTSQTADDVSYWIPTDCNWDTYLRNQFSAKWRSEIRRRLRVLDAEGGFEKQILRSVPDAPSIAAAFADVEKDHVDAAARYPSYRPFLEEVLALASTNGWLRGALLYHHDRLVAYRLAFLYHGRYYLYKVSHRAEVRRLGGAKLLMLYFLEQCFVEGGGPIDFLRGAEPYKSELTDRVIVNSCLRAARPSLRAAVGGRILFELMPMLRLRSPRLHRELDLAMRKGAREVGKRLLRRLLSTVRQAAGS